MVQVLPLMSQASRLGSAFGSGFSEAAIPAAREAQNYSLQRSRLQNALAGLENLNQPGTTPADLLKGLLSSTAGIPGSERYVGQLYQAMLPQLLAKGTQNVDYNVRKPGRGQEFLQQNAPMQQQNLPSFGQTQQPLGQPQQANAFFPSNISGNQQPGNVPQAATEGLKKPVFSANELLDEGKRIAAQQSAAGIPTTAKQGFDLAKEINDENKLYNKEVDAELKERRIAQGTYGELAKEKLANVFPEATDEQKAYIARKGEEIAGENKSEADIERHIAAQVRKFKNTLANIKNDLPAARSFNKLFRSALGKEKSFEQARGDLRVKLQPLLKEGLYGTARNLLSELGYQPEERESILTNLSENVNKTLAEMPEKRKFGTKNENFSYGSSEIASSPANPKTKEKFNQNIRQVLSEDPNANLILLRKQYEDRGVDWRTFKNELNQLVDSGEFKLNDDQLENINVIDEPPLDYLDKILHGLGIIGR